MNTSSPSTVLPPLTSEAWITAFGSEDFRSRAMKRSSPTLGSAVMYVAMYTIGEPDWVIYSISTAHGERRRGFTKHTYLGDVVLRQRARGDSDLDGSPGSRRDDVGRAETRADVRKLGRVLALEAVVDQGHDVAGGLGDLEDEPAVRVDRELRAGVYDAEGGVGRCGQEGSDMEEGGK